MCAVMLEVDPALLAERALRGCDTRNEMWEGVLQMVAQPFVSHQRITVQELLVIDRDTKSVELYLLRGGALLAATPDRDGWFHSESVRARFRNVVGEIEIELPSGVVKI